MANPTHTSPRTWRHRGRFSQVPIYFMKLIRMFIYQNDWCVLPLSALIAAMVAMVIRHGFAVNMDGTLKGAFALSCVAIWNGCFNSIQIVCRERNIVKREHRSGMHISSYIFAHMLYQALLCFLQTALTMAILWISGVHLSGAGIVTQWRIIDISISMFLISYSADMLSLMISCFVHSTTVAMTVMPFVLIFQLVFSGGIFTSLPGWADPLTDLTLSKFGLNCIAAQADYNELPMSIGWQLIKKCKNEVLIPPQSLGDIIELADYPEAKAYFDEQELNKQMIAQITVNDVIQQIGEKEAEEIVNEKLAAASHNDAFESSTENVIYCWFCIIFSGMLYVFLATIALEFIDKDKR